MHLNFEARCQVADGITCPRRSSIPLVSTRAHFVSFSNTTVVLRFFVQMSLFYHWAAREIQSPFSRSMSMNARAMLTTLKKRHANEFLEGSSRTKETQFVEKDRENPYLKRETPVEILKHRQRMKESFPEGWNPPRKISREAMDGLRVLHRHDPATFTTPVLAERFKISPEAVRRILRSKWQPNKEERSKLLEKDRKRKQGFIQQRIDRETADRQRAMDKQKADLSKKWREKDELTLK